MFLKVFLSANVAQHCRFRVPRNTSLACYFNQRIVAHCSTQDGPNVAVERLFGTLITPARVNVLPVRRRASYGVTGPITVINGSSRLFQSKATSHPRRPVRQTLDSSNDDDDDVHDGPYTPRSPSGSRTGRPFAGAVFNPYRRNTPELSDESANCGWIQNSDVPDSEAGDFNKFRISAALVARLKEKGIPYLFPVQTSTFNPIYDNEDVIVQARTGSGKTLSYTLPLVEKLLQTGTVSSSSHNRFPRMLVMAPTRELARQVTDVIESLTDSLSVACIYGGAAIGPQESKLRSGVDVVVGTPGRIMDMMERGCLRLSQVQHVVLDEVDRMLDMGFADSVNDILKDRYVQGSPDQNPQTLLFSATIPTWVQNTARKYLRRDIRKLDLVGKGTVRTATSVEHLAISCPYNQRKAVIVNTLKVYSGDHGRAIVFCERKHEANELAASRAIKTETHVLHGDIPQATREKVLKGFRDGRYKVLIATDVAARGLDIPEVDLVIQCCPPKDVDSYIHRSGRTGRAGRPGVSVLLYKPSERQDLNDVERQAGIRFKVVSPPRREEITAASAEDAAKSLDQISAEVADRFKAFAAKLIESRGAEPALSAALAVISGAANNAAEDESEYSTRRSFQGYREDGGDRRPFRASGGSAWRSVAPWKKRSWSNSPSDRRTFRHSGLDDNEDDEH